MSVGGGGGGGGMEGSKGCVEVGREGDEDDGGGGCMDEGRCSTNLKEISLHA